MGEIPVDRLLDAQINHQVDVRGRVTISASADGDVSVGSKRMEGITASRDSVVLSGLRLPPRVDWVSPNLMLRAVQGADVVLKARCAKKNKRAPHTHKNHSFVVGTCYLSFRLPT